MYRLFYALDCLLSLLGGIETQVAVVGGLLARLVEAAACAILAGFHWLTEAVRYFLIAMVTTRVGWAVISFMLTLTLTCWLASGVCEALFTLIGGLVFFFMVYVLTPVIRGCRLNTGN